MFFEVPKDIVDHFRYILVFVDICGFPMDLMGYPEVLWVFMEFFRFFEVQKDIFGHFGYIWVLTGICGFPMALVGYPGILWGVWVFKVF